jgi:hypothetical protein
VLFGHTSTAYISTQFKGIGRPWRILQDNIKKDFQEVGWDMDSTELAQDKDTWRAVVNAVMKPRVQKRGKFLDYLRTFELLKTDSASCF